jgi:hypothetical protein
MSESMIGTPSLLPRFRCVAHDNGEVCHAASQSGWHCARSAQRRLLEVCVPSRGRRIVSHT